MATAHPPTHHAPAVARQIVRTHLRSVIPIGAAVAIGSLALGFLVAVYVQAVGSLGFVQLVTLATTAEALTTITVILAIPIVLLAILATLVWAGLAVKLAYAAINSRRVSTGGAALSSLRRSPQAFVLVLFIGVCVLGAALITPLLIVVGLLGLLLAAIAKRRPDAAIVRIADRLPERSTLIVMAIPFGFALRLLVRWSLAPASLWIADTSIRASLGDSRARVRSHEVLVAVTLLLAGLVSLAATEGFVALIALGNWGAYPEFVARLIALIVVGPLLWVASAVHYRRGGSQNRLDAPREAPLVGAKASRMGRIAVVVIASLIVPIVIAGGAAPANAATGTAATGTVQSELYIETSPSTPLPANAPTDIRFSVADPFSAEGIQPGGEITITIDGVPQAGPFVLDGFGIGSPITITRSFTPGSHVIAASYPGDDTYAASSDSITITAGYPTAMVLATTGSPAEYGFTTSLTATLTAAGAATSGDVDFYASLGGGPLNVIGTATVSGGVATFDISHLAPGSYALAAEYLGDATHLPIWESGLAHSVTGANTTTSFTVTPTTPSAAGETLTAHVSVAAPTSAATPTGSVDIYLNGGGSSLGNAALSGGTADVDFVLPPGVNQTVTAIYSPGTGFYASQTDLSHTVSPYVGGVSLLASDVATVFGQNLRLTATVTAGGTATGPVSFEATPTVGAPIDLGSATLDAGGDAVLDTAALPVGDYSIVASYAGDSTVDAGSSSGLAHTVAKATASVAVVPSVLSPEFSSYPTFTITVTALAPGAGTPTGTVTVSRDGAELDTVSVNGSGVATLEVDVGDAGDHTFTVAYSGDANFAASGGTLDMTVRQLQTAIYLPGPYDRLNVYGDDQTYEGSVVGNPRGAADGSVPSGTVQLWIHGYRSAVGTLNSAGGYSITTDLGPVGPSALLDAWVTYLGDTNFAPSDSRAWSDTSTAVIDQADVPPVITSTPAADTLGIGTPVTFFATMPHLGAGATGDVDFYRNGVKIGTGTISGDVASFDYTIADTNSTITAEYLGDKNFAASTSAPFFIIADRNAVVVTLADPGSYEYGQILELDASITIGAGAAVPFGVTFRTTANHVLAAGVPVVAGHAVLEVCAGDAAGCPPGAIVLGTSDDGIYVTYGETATNLPGQSATIDYTLAKAATTTTVDVSPSTVAPGGTVTLTATVAGVTSAATPTNYVTFYGLTPLDGGGTAKAFIGNATLVNGVATFIATAGAGATELRWPADAIVADYYPGASQFAASSGSKAITVDRAPVTFGLSFLSPVVYGSTTVTVSLAHAPGLTGNFDGQVVITAASGSTCSQWPAAGVNMVSCGILWPTVGADSYTVTYSGDPLGAPSTSAVEPVTVARGTPVLGATTRPGPVAGMDTTVNWNLFHAAATGTVTVFGNGTVWCNAVPVSDQSCTGQFDFTSATGSPVDIRVQYSGDTNWQFAEEILSVTVDRCATLDVRSSDPARGSVTVDTAPNCGATGYLTGTSVTVSATPTAPNDFVNWLWYGTSGSTLIDGSVASTTTFDVTTDPFSWVHVAKFELPCYPVTASTTGSGAINVVPASNCTTHSGAAGYLHGTAVKIYPVPGFNRVYDENDLFYNFGTQLAGSTIVPTSALSSYVATTVTSAVAVPVTFGPRCRTVEVTFDAASDGDASSVDPEENCHSPQGNGYVRGSYVAVSATPGASNHVFTGWSVGGVPQPKLDGESAPILYVDATNLSVTANYVGCYTLKVDLDGASNEYGRIAGTVDTDREPNCPDGSSRYQAGTVVTLTPMIHAEGAVFGGWDDGDQYRRFAPTDPSGIGSVPDGVRAITIEDDLTVTANFFLASACSKLTVYGQVDLMSIDSNGCGPGYYSDQQKVLAIRNGVLPYEMWQTSHRTYLQVNISDDEPLSVYASVTGDTRGCFGTPVGPSGPTEGRNVTKTYGPLSPGLNDCPVGGTIRIQLEACQAIQASPEIHVEGDDRTFGSGNLPQRVLMQGPDGTVGILGIDSSAWMQTMGVYVNSDSISYQAMASGPCKEAGNAFPANSDIALYAISPMSGFTFDGWSHVFPNSLIEAVAAENMGIELPDLLKANPMLRTTNETDRRMSVTPSYTVTCHHLVLGEGITVEGLIPRCPGTKADDNLFIAGTVVQVRAQYIVGGDRQNYGYTDGVIGGQVAQDKLTLDLIGYVAMDGDKAVAADYPNKTEKFRRGLVQGLKLSVAFFAIAAPIAIGLFFPPMGIFFALVGAGAGISILLGDDKAASVFDMMNPTNVMTCAARWSFANSGDSTGAYNPGSVVSLGKSSYDIIQGKDIIMKPISDLRSIPLGIGAKLPDKLANIPGGLSFALAAAGFGVGLYNAGIADAPLGTQTVDQLRGTSTMTGCLDEKYRFAGANSSGN